MAKETLTVQLFKLQAEVASLRDEISSLKEEVSVLREQRSQAVLSRSRAIPLDHAARVQAMAKAKAEAMRTGKCVKV